MSLNRLSQKWGPVHSRGAFLQVVSQNPEDWRHSIEFLSHLPNLQHIELWLEFLPSGADLKRLKRLLRDLTILVHAPFVHLSLVTHAEEVRKASIQRCKEAIAVASALDARVVTIHAGSHGTFEPESAGLNRLIDSLK